MSPRHGRRVEERGRRRVGAYPVALGSASPSTSAISDSVDWIVRLRRAFGIASPHAWGRRYGLTLDQFHRR